jgi:hypothetical protein
MTSDPAAAPADDAPQDSNESAESEKPSPPSMPTDADTHDTFVRPSGPVWESAKRRTSAIGIGRIAQLEYLIRTFHPLTEEEFRYIETLINSLHGSKTEGETSLSQIPGTGDVPPLPPPPVEPDGPTKPPPKRPTSQGNPDEPDRRFRDVWIGFVQSVRTLINTSISDLPRFTDQFRQWATQVLKVAESAVVADKLLEAYNATEHRLRELLLMELLGVNEAVEVARQTEPGEKWPTARKILLGTCGTALDSLKDIFSDFLDKNPFVKGILTLFGEGVDMFRGD